MAGPSEFIAAARVEPRNWTHGLESGLRREGVGLASFVEVLPVRTFRPHSDHTSRAQSE